MDTLTLDTTTLPVLYACDVVIVGGSLAGVSAALTMARAGRHVVLVEPCTYLGREVTATLRPWVRMPAGAAPETLPEVVRACIEASGTTQLEDEFPLHPDAVKVCLEDSLLELGVKLVYASLPVGLCTQDGRLQGVIIANKSGRQVLTCQLLLDATATALVTRFTGVAFEEPPQSARFAITLEFDGVAFQEETGMVERVRDLPVPPNLGIAADTVTTHRGHLPGTGDYNHGHVLVECPLELSYPLTAQEMTQCTVEARRKAFALASYLLWNDHHFRLAHLGSLSQELYGPHSMPMAGSPPDWAVPMAAEHVDMGRGDLAVSCFATPVVGVWCLNEAVRAEDAAREAMREPIVASRLGEQLACALHSRWQAASAPQAARPEPGPAASVLETTATRSLRVKEPCEVQRGRHDARYPTVAMEVPIAADVDVLVVGGGTAGAIAAITAAQEGVRTAVIEMNPGLGGTATYGGVRHYWAGWQGGFTARSREWVNRVHDQVRYPRTYGLVGGWNIEAKVQALTEQAQAAGADLLFGALAFAAVVDGDAVRGVVVATPAGPLALLGKVVIDATGDGDVAAFAGAEFQYGSPRDHAVMWYSLPQIGRPGQTHNNFTSMVDVSNILDYNRAILSGRRRGDRLHDHGAYIATRESRRVVGDVTQTLSDQLLQRCWPDVIGIAVSNNDIKGQISSDWMRIGMIPPNLEIECPYRMLLPKGLKNILVVGKAVSVARDALPAIRMQPDIENQGGAAGLAAAIGVRSGQDMREINIRALQARLVDVGALPQRVLTRQLVPRRRDDAELQTLIKCLVADERPFHAYSMMNLNEVWRGPIALVEICCAGPQVLPLLEQALSETAGSGRLRLAQALALVGSRAGVPVLIDALEQQLAGDRLPERISFIKHVDMYSPDQAAMPDAAYLLYALGMTRDQRALPVWQRVVDLLAPVREEDVWSQAKGVFCYVDALCLGAERLGDPAAIPLLRQLHSYPPFHRKMLHSGFQANYLLERPAYLEVVIGRALARCGSPEGVAILIDYLSDVRGLLAEHAHDELIAVSGQDFGKDVAAWTQWLEMEGESLQPSPWVQPTEPIAAWGEIVLTAKDPVP